MEGNKLDLSGKPTSDLPASYKVIPEADMEEEAVTRPKSLVKSKPVSPEADGADEKMLPKEETVDVTNVKISSNEKQNGDAKLDIGELRSAFVGLTKEELMKYANDPFWVRLRWCLFITFWILWGAMLLGAIIIICAAPKCDPPPPRTWWQKGPLTEIEHDLQPEEVKSLKEKGVTGVIIPWLEDAYSDFDETSDIIATVKKYKDEGFNVIIELEPGNSEVWFNKSEYRDPEFSDYYIWRPPKSGGDAPEPPNNWLTVDSNSSWIYSDKRKEFYYSPVGKPHLNFRNPNVTDEFSRVLKKFLDHGIGGIRLRGVPFLLVDAQFQDETSRNVPGFDHGEYGFYAHTKTENLPDLGPLLKEWNVIVKNKTENGPFMVAEDLSKIEAYKINNSLVIDLPVRSHLLSKLDLTASDIVNRLNSTFNIDGISWPLWKSNSSDVLDIVTFLLPGTPLIKQDADINDELLKIRNSPSIMRGNFTYREVGNKTVFAFVREISGNPGILVALNPTETKVVVDFPSEIKEVSEEVTIQLYSNEYKNSSEITLKNKQDAHKIPLLPKSAIVLSYVPKTS